MAQTTITHQILIKRYYFKNRIVEVRSEIKDGMMITQISIPMGERATSLEDLYQLGKDLYYNQPIFSH